MTSATPEQQQAGMELWQAWAGKAGPAIIDLGSPLGDGEIVGGGEAYDDIAGFSILEAESQSAIVTLLDDHPHLHMPGGRIEVHELLAMPAS
jgi:hypothetical protein